MRFADTLGSIDWLNAKEKELRDMFPETWTHIQNILYPAMMYRLKLLGIDWRSEEEFTKIMDFFKDTKVYLLNNASQQMKRNHVKVVFKKVFSMDGKKEVEVVKEKESGIASATKTLAAMTLFTAWIMGFVLAKGFWSTLFCFIPFWAWYLVVEHVMVLTKFIPS